MKERLGVVLSAITMASKASLNTIRKIIKKLSTVQTSKKLAWFSGTCFAVAIIYCMITYARGAKDGGLYDTSMLVTLLSTTGAVFGVTMIAYNSKSRYENVVKIQKGYLREKYDILKEMGVLDYSRAISEIEEEFSDIEETADNEKLLANQEITYNG